MIFRKLSYLIFSTLCIIMIQRTVTPLVFFFIKDTGFQLLAGPVVFALAFYYFYKRSKSVTPYKERTTISMILTPFYYLALLVVIFAMPSVLVNNSSEGLTGAVIGTFLIGFGLLIDFAFRDMLLKREKGENLYNRFSISS